MAVKNSCGDEMVFLLSIRFGMVLVAVVVDATLDRMVFVVEATLDMLDDVTDPPSDNDDGSVVRSTMGRRRSMMLSRTRVPTMGSVIDAESGFVWQLLLLLVSEDESLRGRFGLLV